MEQNESVIQLKDENGKDVNFYHLDTVEYKGKYYVALEAAEDCDGCKEGECIILRIDQDADSNEDIYVTPEEDELDAVTELIVERLEGEEEEDEFLFADGDEADEDEEDEAEDDALRDEIDPE